jgi:uncharacterized protein VirK/YbjX
LNKLNSQSGTEVINANVVCATSRYAYADPQALEDGLWSAIRRLVVEQFASLRGLGLRQAVEDILHSMHGRFDWRGSPAQRRKTAAKYVVRTLSMPRQHARYLAFVFGDPRMRAYQRRDPRLLERHFHRHMHAGWNRHERLQSIRHHYQFALARWPSVLFEAIYGYGNATLGCLTLKDGSQLKLCLQPPIFLGCEGELCIQLSDAEDHPIYRIVLSVIDDQPTIAIGCIQGPDGEDGKALVRDLTKNMHGMRPKQLMLSLVYALARNYAAKRILAIGNAAHPLRRARDRFQADYDAFWQEQKGVDIGNGWFQLPETPSRKSEAEVASQHRSAFRRRESMRMEAERLLIEGLECFPPRKPAHAGEAVDLCGHPDAAVWKHREQLR